MESGPEYRVALLVYANGSDHCVQTIRMHDPWAGNSTETAPRRQSNASILCTMVTYWPIEVRSQVCRGRRPRLSKRHSSGPGRTASCCSRVSRTRQLYSRLLYQSSLSFTRLLFSIGRTWAALAVAMRWFMAHACGKEIGRASCRERVCQYV